MTNRTRVPSRWRGDLHPGAPATVHEQSATGDGQVPDGQAHAQDAAIARAVRVEHETSPASGGQRDQPAEGSAGVEVGGDEQLHPVCRRQLGHGLLQRVA